LFAATLPEDLCLVPHSQAQQVRKVAGGRGTWVSFGGEEDAGFRYHQGVVWHEGTPVADVRASEFANEVTGPMVCAVAACGRRAGMNWAAIERGIAGFRGLPHRMQRLGAVNQVEYVNDSKSTSLSALSAALTRLREPIRLIAGGVLKEDNVMVPADALRRRVAAAYLIGEGAAVLHAAWSGFVECRVYPTLEEAFAGAHRDARPGETILLSPGAASFDQFANYRERGKRFEALVEQAARTDAGTGCNVKPIDNTEGCARMAECRNEKKEKCA
jgi:UDP-N-acetylmuramoylalanine-D-glutamate ligase